MPLDASTAPMRSGWAPLWCGAVRGSDGEHAGQVMIAARRRKLLSNHSERQVLGGQSGVVHDVPWRRAVLLLI